MRPQARQVWGEDLIRALLAILYEVAHSFYRFFWVMRLGQKILKFYWWVVIDVNYIIAKEFLIFYNLVNLFTAQNRLDLGPQIPTVWMILAARFEHNT